MNGSNSIIKNTAPVLTPDLCFCGSVTQSGTILQNGHRFDALQSCKIRLTSVSASRVECEVHRTEMLKFVDDIENPCDPRAATALPPYLISYLRDKGSCVERAVGTYDPFTRVLLLKGVEVTVSEPSDVLWSPHFYSLVVESDRVVGTAFCMDGLQDRENEVGSVELRRL